VLTVVVEISFSSVDRAAAYNVTDPGDRIPWGALHLSEIKYVLLLH
jgi:hypothetical protein